MSESMAFGPRRSIRESQAVRGLLFGAALGLIAGLVYLIVIIAIVLITGPLIFGNLQDSPVPAGSIEAGLVVPTFFGGLVVGVLPATIAGAAAGAVIGAAGSVIARSKKAAWLGGTLVCCLIAAALMIITQTITHPDLVRSSIGVMILWIPLLIFVVAGGPFAIWLYRDQAARSDLG